MVGVCRGGWGGFYCGEAVVAKEAVVGLWWFFVLGFWWFLVLCFWW